MVNKIEELQKLVNQEIKNITYEGQMTIVEFVDGQILPLYGGVAGISEPLKAIRYCSFCGNEGTKEKPVVSLNSKDDPLICPDCAINAIQTLIENGIEVELDISSLASNELLEKLLEGKK
ncbi:gp683 [Bacillus phage G]|uniref:Gp683 n=1 Tax=Bacillus phage G TaxID=2884420 RepID=G3MB63_9CAUD|nr:gp683 [Bacillus phage G]AEO93926.1 gp683 [Bacillus phage G]